MDETLILNLGLDAPTSTELKRIAIFRAVPIVNSIDTRYYFLMIRSFKNKETEKVWNRDHVRALAPELQRAAPKEATPSERCLRTEQPESAARKPFGATGW